MQNDDSVNNLFVEGSARRVVYAITASGTMPAKEFFDALSEKEQKKFAMLFCRMAHVGVITNKEQFAFEQDGIYAFKIWQRRIYCFQAGKDWVLTNGCVKKQNKAKPKDLAIADRISKEHSHHRKVNP